MRHFPIEQRDLRAAWATQKLQRHFSIGRQFYFQPWADNSWRRNSRFSASSSATRTQVCSWILSVKICSPRRCCWPPSSANYVITIRLLQRLA